MRVMEELMEFKEIMIEIGISDEIGKIFNW